MTENKNDEVLNLVFLYRPIVDNFRIFVLSIFAAFCLSLFISFKLTELYKSEAVIAIQDKYKLLYNNADNGLAQGLGLLSGESPSYGTDFKVISILKSRDFFKKLYNDKSFMQHTFAIDFYDKGKSFTNFSENLVGVNNGYDMSKRPPFFEAHTTFLNEHLEVSKDRDSGLIIVSMKSKSPSSSKLTLEIVINSFVIYLSSREKHMAESSYNFLTEMLKKSNPQAVDRALSNMLQSDIQKITLSNSSSGLIEIIDSPYEPIRKSEPSKLIFTLAATVFISILIYLFLVIRAFIQKKY